MKVIYKYKLEFDDRTDIDAWKTSVQLPVGAQILTAGAQGTDVFIWAIIDKDRKETFTAKFRVIPTGLHAFDDYNLSYLSTVFMNNGQYVFHIFREQGMVYF